MQNPLLTPDKEKALLDGLYDALDDAHHKKGSPGYGDMSVLARWGSREGIEALAGILNLTYGRPCFGNSFKYLQKEAREALLTCPEPLGRFYSGLIVRSVTEICFAVTQEPDLKNRLESYIVCEGNLDSDESPSMLFMAADMAREALPIIEDPHKLEIVLSRRKQKYEELERMHQEAIRKHRSNPVLCSQCGAVLGTWQLLTRARTHKKCEMEKDRFCGTGLLVTQLFHVHNSSQLFNIYCGTMDEGSHSCAFAANICDDQNQELAILSCHSWKTGFVFASGISTLSPGLYRLDVSQANGPWTVQHLEY